MKTKILLPFIIIAFVSSAINAQTSFQRVYSNIHAFNSVQQTTDGGYIVAGYDTAHACLLKLDANANTVWSKTFRGSDHRQFTSVYQTSDGGYIAAGDVTTLNSPYYSKVYLVRINANGDTLWTRCYGGTSSDYAYSVKQTPDSGFAIAGRTNSFGYGAYLIKTDANGNILWTKTYASNNSGICNEIQNTSDGGFIMIGQGESPYPYSSYEISIIKTNSTGDTLWTRGFSNYNGMDEYTGTSVIQTSDGGYMALGNMANSSFNDGQAVMIKLNSTGDTSWTKKLSFSDFYSPSYTGNFNSIKQTTDGGYVIAGDATYGNSPVSSGIYAVLIKTDMNGDTLWTKKYGEGSQYNGSDLSIYDLKQTNDSGYILAGYSYSPGYGAYLVKTDLSGNVSCGAGYANFNYVHFPLSIFQGATLGSGGSANGVYTVAGTFDTTYINPCLPVPSICMVTVDSATQKNRIIWEKNFDTTLVNSYNIYRETTSSGVYAKIGNVLNSSLSTFIDYASNPPQKANRYEITTVDAHGIESYTKSVAHKTIHLSVNLGVPPQINLIWDTYEGFAVSTYRIWRGNAGGMYLIDSIQSSLTNYTDLTPPANDTIYFIEALNPSGSCTPTAKGFSSTKSNAENIKKPNNIIEHLINTAFIIYPNPANDNITIENSAFTKDEVISVYDIQGQLLLQQPILHAKTNINIAAFSKGLYFLKVENEKGIAVKMFVKE